MGTFYQTCTQVQGYFIKSYEKKNSITVNISHLTDQEAQEEPKMYFDNYSFFDMYFFLLASLPCATPIAPRTFILSKH